MLRYTYTQQDDEYHRKWYGICALRDGKTVAQARQLTRDKRSVQHLVRQMNTYQPSLMHFSELVDDFLTGN